MSLCSLKVVSQSSFLGTKCSHIIIFTCRSDLVVLQYFWLNQFLVWKLKWKRNIVGFIFWYVFLCTEGDGNVLSTAYRSLIFSFYALTHCSNADISPEFSSLHFLASTEILQMDKSHASPINNMTNVIFDYVCAYPVPFTCNEYVLGIRPYPCPNVRTLSAFDTKYQIRIPNEKVCKCKRYGSGILEFFGVDWMPYRQRQVIQMDSNSHPFYRVHIIRVQPILYVCS